MAGFPVLGVGFDPRPATQIGVDWNVPVRVGGATVLPGDAATADDTERVNDFETTRVRNLVTRAFDDPADDEGRDGRGDWLLVSDANGVDPQVVRGRSR